MQAFAAGRFDSDGQQVFAAGRVAVFGIFVQCRCEQERWRSVPRVLHQPCCVRVLRVRVCLRCESGAIPPVRCLLACLRSLLAFRLAVCARLFLE